jgi:spermidine synthase
MLHFAPGLSDNAVIALGTLPRQAFWGLYVDGEGPIGIMGALRPEEAAYMDWLPMAAPYTLLDRPRVLLVNLGGAINAQMARSKGASSITVAERDPEVVRLLGDDPLVSAFTGRLLDDPRIRLVKGEPRALCQSSPGAFDLVEISLVDSVGLSDPGGYPVTENYTYTEEAIAAYLGALEPNGILSITVWNRLDPPRNVLRLLATVVEALRRTGVSDPHDRLFVFDLYLSTATILVKKSPFTDGQIYDLRRFATERSFDVVYYPGIPKRPVDFDDVISTYQRHFAGGAPLKQNASFSVSDVYHLALLKMLAGRQDDVYHAYPFDIRPIRDDRPYYTGFLRLDRIGMYLDQVRDVSEEWGELLILGILLEAVLFGLLVIGLPVVGRWRELFRHRRGVAGVIVYYAALGLAYMMVEIFLMQRLVFFLGNPVYSTALVISSMLVLSALGNLAAPLLARRRVAAVRIAVGVILASLAFYAFGLRFLFDRFLSSPMAVRVLLSIAVVVPSAFFMGVPFPTGLVALTEHRPRLLPWAWGMNGGLSVAGTALAQVVALSAGFPLVLGVVASLYAVVGVLFPVNEIADSTGGAG